MGLTLFDFAPGRRVDDRFEIGTSQRQGGMFAAFDIIDLSNGEPRELQVFPSGIFETPAQSRDFATELDGWRAVTAPRVLRVHEVIARGDFVLLLTDRPRGPSLRSWLAGRKRLDVDVAVALGCDALEGLEAIHANGLVHGDVKPFTIHVEEVHGAPRAMLVDGGITKGLWTAKHLGEKTALIGTPVYAPVEQFGGDSPNAQSDIYNVATVLFELIAGAVPWPGSSFLEVFQAKLAPAVPTIRQRAPDIKVPTAVEEAILDGLRSDARERWATAREFRSALQAALED